MYQGRRASRLPLAFIFCAFGAAFRQSIPRIRADYQPVSKGGARLRWQSQPRELGRLTRLRGCRAVKYCWAGLGRHRYWFLRHELNHSTGTTYSLARTMLSRERAASSMVRGSVRSLCTSAFNVVLTVRKASTSVCIAVSCCAAI